MKTIFSRTFVPAALILLIAFSGVGIMFHVHTRQAMDDRMTERLENQAQTVATLATAYYESGFTESEAFCLNLTMAARASGMDTVVCDRDGVLLICADSPLGCSHQGLTIAADYLNNVLENGLAADKGTIPGLYEDVRYVVSVPIYTDGGQTLGIVISSCPVGNNQTLLNTMTRNFVIAAVVALVISAAGILLVTQKNTRALQTVRDAAVAFGHGNLDARVQVDARSPEDVHDLALAFNNMADSLKKSEYQRQQFVANVSHELKTPMTTIAGFADGILDGTIGSQQQEHYLRLISEETKRLNRLVRSMLDISRLQDDCQIPESQKTRFEIQECAGRVLLSFERRINEKNIDVQVDMPELPIFTRAHSDNITQVIYNLFDNAVKFCPQDGTLGLTVRTGGNKCYVSISNTGQTIPPEELPLLFDRFHKLDKSRSENRDGWGLGLYIVKTIVCAHGEDISVTSQNGVTEFTFTLPLIS